MPASTRQIVKEGTIQTGSLSAGLLKPSQSKKFLKQVFDSTEMGKLIRHVTKVEKTGEIDKIGIGKRILRQKVENTDDGYRAKPDTSLIKYATTAVRLPWEITEEALRENIEGQNFEKVVTDLMTTQMGLDTIDLLFNADTATAEDDPDYDFLKLDDGYIKQVETGGNVYDGGASALTLDTFYNALQLVPSKYISSNTRWIMSPHTKQNWERTLYNHCIQNGSTAPESMYKAPAGVAILDDPLFPDDKIMITDPKNLIAVDTYGVKVRKTTEGKEAVMQDKRFYVVHFDIDAVIEELEATGLVTNFIATAGV